MKALRNECQICSIQKPVAEGTANRQREKFGLYALATSSVEMPHFCLSAIHQIMQMEIQRDHFG
mgnify:CR=1 FL=1